MLAKQLWGLIINPSSVAYRILKAKYFPRVDIMQAQLGYKPSYLWRSLLASKKVIEEGIAWRIGNGATARIRDERWVGVREITTPKELRSSELDNQNVAQLIDMETMRWKEQDILDNFCHEDAMKILSIPLSTCTTTDKRVWRLTKHGFYTVKSAYHTAVATFSNAKGIQASPSRCLKEWKKLWEIKTLPRVKMFLWRACIDAIPSRVNLCRRGSDIDPICPLCGEASETTNHIFLSCKTVKNVWYTSVLRLDVSGYSDSSFRHLLWDKLNQEPPEYVALFAYMAWEIWRARNIKCFEDKMFDVMSVQKSAHAKWKNDMEGRDIAEKNTQSSSVKNTRGQKTSMDQLWKTPSAGIKKLNCDAAVGNEGKVGLGFVLRDENGRVLLAGKWSVWPWEAVHLPKP